MGRGQLEKGRRVYKKGEGDKEGGEKWIEEGRGERGDMRGWGAG
jgi:hypothetical protein